MSEQSQYDLFVSYADADRAWVEGYLLDALDAAGVKYHSEKAFDLGVPRLVAFERAIRGSRRTLLVLSPEYLADQFGQFTDLLAQTYGLETATWPAIPLILRSVELPPRLAMLTALDATEPEQQERAIVRLCEVLSRPAPGAPARPPCPYPGMLPFAEEDGSRFFGRDTEVDEMVERLRLHPFLVVIGPSGSGKSSLVFAGLIPALRRSGRFGRGELTVRAVRPGVAPMSALTDALGDNPTSPTMAAPPETNNLLLVVDQFEELFTLAAADGEAFQRALLELSRRPRCYVVLTVRADFYQDLMACPLWAEIQRHRLEVLPLGADGLRQAIVRPAENVGVFIETALVERLATDAANEPGILPLVQETLSLLWERMERRFLSLNAYKSLILSHGAYDPDAKPVGRTGLQVAMARRADAALADLDDVQQAVVRRIFLRLIQFGEGRADTRRQQGAESLRAAGDDAACFEVTLSHLAERRLLTMSGEEQGSRKVDIAHEALIAGWPTLRRWVNERREAEQTRRRLQSKADEWARLGRGSGGLLDEVELREAEQWLDSFDAAELGYSEASTALVKTSREAQVATEKQRRRAIRFRWGALGAIALLIILALSVWLLGSLQLAEQRKRTAETAEAGRIVQVTLVAKAEDAQALEAAQRATAEANARVALARQLAAQAELIRSSPGGSWNLAGLLAAESLHRQPDTVEAMPVGYRLLERLGRPLVNLAHNGSVNSAAFSPDGQRVVTVGCDEADAEGSCTIGLARIWDALTGQELARLVHDNWVWSAMFSPNGQQVVTASGYSARIWDVVTGQELARLAHDDVVRSASFSPDGQQVITASNDNTARVWDAISGQELACLTHDYDVDLASFSPDGQRVVTASGSSARVWDWAIGQELAYLTHNGQVSSVAFSPDGQRIVTASYDGTAGVWDVSTSLNVGVAAGKEPVRLVHGGRVNSAVFSPDGQRVVTVGCGNTSKPGTCISDIARVWDALTGQELARLAHDGEVYSASFSPDGQWIVTASYDKTARVWDATTGRELTRLAHDGAVLSAAFSPDGGRVFTASWDGAARIWSTATGQELVRLAHDGGVRSASFSPDGGRVVTVSGDLARVWDWAGGKELARLTHHDQVNSAAFSPDGQRVVTASGDSAWVWDWATGQELAHLAHGGKVNSAAFSPDGQRVVTASSDKTARVWDWATGQELARLAHGDEVNSAAFSPDGQRVVTASWDRTARVWDATNGQELSRLAYNDLVSSAAFSPDGQWVVTASWDQTARVWDATSGRELAHLEHDHIVNSAMFSPDGGRVVTASWDNTARVWIAPDTLLDRLCLYLPRNLTRDEWRQYLGSEPYRATCPNLPTPPAE